MRYLFIIFGYIENCWIEMNLNCDTQLLLKKKYLKACLNFHLKITSFKIYNDCIF